MKDNVAFFPFGKDELPIIKHFKKMQNNYILRQVISWRGDGLNGKDAATVCNHPAIGTKVIDQINVEDSSWEILLVELNEINKSISSLNLEEIFIKCLIAGKKIIFLCNCLNDLTSEIISLVETYPEGALVLSSDASVKHDLWGGIKYTPLSVPVLLVGGLVDQSDTLEVTLALKEGLSCDGNNVSCILGNNAGMLLGAHSYRYIFDDTSIRESDKILRLNQLARDIIRSERPNLLIVESPDPVMKFNNMAPNGFGILTYMTYLALSPGMFVCCIPCDMCNSSFIDQISLYFSTQYGLPICAVHATNALIDYMAMIQCQEVSTTHIDMESVSKLLAKSTNGAVPVYNVVSEEVSDFYKYILSLVGQ